MILRRPIRIISLCLCTGIILNTVLCSHSVNRVSQPNLGVSKHPCLLPKTFLYKGVECVNPDCSCIGTQLIQGMDHSGNLHWDVYTEDWVLMTVDHIIPKSKGGTYHLDNLNPMCSHCNGAKADK